MNPFLLYLLLLKAMLTSFSGMASLPMVRNDFVVERHVLTDRELNTAVVTGRTGPGPNGAYLVSVGYFVGGLPGAFAGLLAVITPAFLILPLMKWMSARADSPRVKGAIRAVVLASAGLLFSASLPLVHDAVHGVGAAVIMGVTFALLAFTRIDTAWVILGSAAIGLATKFLG